MKRTFDILGIWYTVAALLFSAGNFIATGSRWGMLGFVICGASLAFLLWTHFEYPKWRERRDQEMRAEFEAEMTRIYAELDARIAFIIQQRVREAALDMELYGMPMRSGPPTAANLHEVWRLH